MKQNYLFKGAFDPIDQVSEICKKYNLWLHVDVSVLEILKPN